MHLEDQNLGARRTVLGNGHEVAIQLRNQAGRSSERLVVADWQRLFDPAAASQPGPQPARTA